MVAADDQHRKNSDQGGARTIRRRSGHLSGVIYFVGALLSILIAAFFAQAWINYKVVEVGYQINQLEKENNQLREHYQQLTVELSNLASSSRIESIALGKLGLKTPLPEQIIKVQ
jgi:cell division protein FtsL